MVNSIKAGITFGALLGISHLSWVLLVAFGWAQPLMDFVFWMHFIRPVYVIQPFSLSAAATVLIIVTAGDRICHRICLRCDLEQAASLSGIGVRPFALQLSHKIGSAL